VEPLLLPDWHLLASIEEEYNAVYLRCASSGDLSLFGKGAGALPTGTALLGDLIDLAQDNSVQWPVPQALPLASAGASVEPAPRRHYLRVTAEPHPGLERRIESLVRRLGLSVQNRASRGADTLVHLAFMISPSREGQIAELHDAVARLARVERCLCLGVLE
jgi:homoserine dehydrogenase